LEKTNKNIEQRHVCWASYTFLSINGLPAEGKQIKVFSYKILYGLVNLVCFPVLSKLSLVAIPLMHVGRYVSDLLIIYIEIYMSSEGLYFMTLFTTITNDDIPRDFI